MDNDFRYYKAVSRWGFRSRVYKSPTAAIAAVGKTWVGKSGGAFLIGFSDYRAAQGAGFRNYKTRGGKQVARIL